MNETVLSSRTIFEGKVVHLKIDTVSIEGADHTFEREIIQHNGAVAIVPLDKNDEVTLVRQYRAGSAGLLLEIPAGGLNKGEDPLEAARRELQEEIGMYPEELIELGRFWVAPSYSTEQIVIYLTRAMRSSKIPGDSDERIEIVKMPFKQALEQALNNEIRDSKTIIALTWTARYLGVQM
jgi:ADP-ribose diphosphatase